MPHTDHTSSPLVRYAEMLVALVVIALGFIVIWETQDVSRGPKQVGIAIGIGQILAGVWYLVEVLAHRRPDSRTVTAEKQVTCATTDWNRLGILALALIAYAVLLERAGFVLASTALIVIGAYALGSHRLLRDGACAVVVSTSVVLVFDRFLDVRLPGGPFPGLL